MMTITYEPIGTIYTPFSTLENMPIQPRGAQGVQGRIVFFPAYSEGLKDIEGFSHVILLYHFHKVGEYRLTVTPFLDKMAHGLFATRAPKRPNAIGFSVVKLLGREGETLTVENIDVLDETPLLDIKPYVPQFDTHAADRIGWLEGKVGNVYDIRSDDRFI